MTWILEGAAVLCLIYYGVICAYSGAATSFALIWPALALFLTALFFGIRYYASHPGVIPLWVPVSGATACAACLAAFVAAELCIGWGALTARPQPADYVIVLGAGVRGQTISHSLKKRLDKAIAYAEEYQNTLLVLSGGQGEGEDLSEARAMYEYLTYNGVPAERLLLEDQSSDTWENITFSYAVIERQEYYKAQAARQTLKDSYRERPGEEIRAAILTSDFHVFRAKSIAKKAGHYNVSAIASPSDPVLAIHLWLREGIAVLKDKFMGRM